MLDLNKVYCQDAIEFMKQLDDKSIDAFITDLPYGITACKWDEIIPFAPMWAEVKRTLKPRGVFVTTASQPFTSKLVMSNLEMFKYEWVWEKNVPSGFLNAKIQPLKWHENIVVFSEGSTNYNPQYRQGAGYKGKTGIKSQVYGKQKEVYHENDGSQYYPKSIVKFDNGNGAGKDHPTQKPVFLLEYLVKTYTQFNDLVCDFCCGSGTTGIAARNLGRNFIMNDITKEYVEVSNRRLSEPYTPRLMEV